MISCFSTALIGAFRSLLFYSVICSLGGPLSHGSLVVVFFDRVYPRFWNFYSTIPVDVDVGWSLKWITSVVCARGWGIWTLHGWGGKFEPSSQRSTRVLSFGMKVFQGYEHTFVSDWLKRKGPQGIVFKAWSIIRKSRSLILPFTKDCLSIPALGWGI